MVCYGKYSSEIGRPTLRYCMRYGCYVNMRLANCKVTVRRLEKMGQNQPILEPLEGRPCGYT